MGIILFEVNRDRKDEALNEKELQTNTRFDGVSHQSSR